MAEDEQVYIESVESRGSMQNVVVFIIIVIFIELCFKKKIIYWSFITRSSLLSFYFDIFFQSNHELNRYL